MELENMIIDYQPTHYHRTEIDSSNVEPVKYRCRGNLRKLFAQLNRINSGVGCLPEPCSNELVISSGGIIEELKMIEKAQQGMANASILYSKEEREYDPYVTGVGSASRLLREKGPF